MTVRDVKSKRFLALTLLVNPFGSTDMAGNLPAGMPAMKGYAPIYMLGGRYEEGKDMRRIRTVKGRNVERYRKRRAFFYGWYFKCQSETRTLAVIPAIHQGGGKRTCSIQVITDDGTWTAEYPGEMFWRKGKSLSIGANRFGPGGIRLAVHTSGLDAEGKLVFGRLFPLKYGIMGPFSLVPFMECRHGVWSMRHSVRGTLHVNGTAYVFDGGQGYWEGDRGRSFPKEYVWTQCVFPGGSLMLSVADIPMGCFRFRGVIGIVLLHGKEYRLATYLGARAAEVRSGLVRVTQGSLELEARLLERTGKPLKAPRDGDMARIIHESAACRASYRFRKGKHTLLDFRSNQASFEYEYPL